MLIETEYCLGMSRGGAKDGTMQYAREILGDMNNGMQAAVDWNLLLDQTGGPYHYRYTGCAAPVHVNTDTKELTLQPSYYGLGKRLLEGICRSSCDVVVRPRPQVHRV